MNFVLLANPLIAALTGKGLSKGAILISDFDLFSYHELTVLSPGSVLSFVSEGEEGTPDFLLNGNYLHGFSDSDQVDMSQLENGVVVFHKRQSGHECTRVYITDDAGKLTDVVKTAVTSTIENAVYDAEMLRDVGMNDQQIVDFMTEQTRQTTLNYLRFLDENQ